MKQNNKGFSLVEVVVAIAILGAFSVSICTSLVLSLRMNEKTNTLMQEQLAVSSAVETLMAEGIEPGKDYNTVSGLTIKVNEVIIDDVAQPYYSVEVKSDNIAVTTQIHKIPPKVEVTE